MLTGVLAPDSGTVILGTNLAMATLDQKRDALDPATPLAEALTRGRGDYVTINGENRHVVGYMKDFLFSPEQKERRSACCPAANAGGCCWRVRLQAPPMCSSLTSRQTIST